MRLYFAFLRSWDYYQKLHTIQLKYSSCCQLLDPRTPLPVRATNDRSAVAKHFLPYVICKCFYPAIYDRDIDPAVYYRNYIQTYIEKDVTELLKIEDLKVFRTFLGLCASRAGQLLNFTALANECDSSHNTARS